MPRLGRQHAYVTWCAPLGHPGLLALDEPPDALTRIEMEARVERRWAEQGFAGVLVTHDAK